MLAVSLILVFVGGFGLGFSAGSQIATHTWRWSVGQAGRLQKSDSAVGDEWHYRVGKSMGRCWWFWFPSFHGTMFERSDDQVASASISWLCYWIDVTRCPWSKKEQARHDAAARENCASVAKENKCQPT